MIKYRTSTLCFTVGIVHVYVKPLGLQSKPSCILATHITCIMGLDTHGCGVVKLHVRRVQYMEIHIVLHFVIFKIALISYLLWKVHTRIDFPHGQTSYIHFT